MKLSRAAFSLSLLGVMSLNPAFNTALAEEFSFSAAQYEKKPYEFKGHLDVMSSQLNVDPNAAFTNLTFQPIESAKDLTRYYSELELEGLYRFDNSTLNFRSLSNWQNDDFSETTQHTLQEAFWSVQPSDQWSLEIGKRAIKWGKGYAWNPVGFIERTKNPDDPEVNREGFILASAEYTRILPGLVKTLSASGFIVPVSDSVNDDFNIDSSNSSADNLVWAGKLYLLIGETDLDFYLRYSTETNTDFGVSFSSNLASNFEVHGDFAYRSQQTQTLLTADNQLVSQTSDSFQGLLGLRYLTESELTWIAEWYVNPQGYSVTEFDTFYDLAHSDPLTSPSDYQLVQQAKQAGYAATNPGQQYLYLRASQKDFADIVYLSAALTGIMNLEDSSYVLTPELIYTGLKNHEFRLRVSALQGDTQTEFGEKLNDLKWEARARFYF